MRDVIPENTGGMGTIKQFDLGSLVLDENEGTIGTVSNTDV